MNYHKIRIIIAVLVMFGLTAGGFLPVVAQEMEQPVHVTALSDAFKAGEVLVKFKEGVSVAQAGTTMERYDATYIRALQGIGVGVWQVPEGEELAVAKRLSVDPQVEYAELNYQYHAFDTVPNDPGYASQWAYPLMGSPAGWDVTTGSASITIAIIDSGIDETHPDLASKIGPGYDFVDGDANPHDLNGHGTHCAGIAAAATNNAIGVAGMDWNARIMPVRVLNEVGSGYTSDIVDGIYWAYQNGAKVLNLSLGGPSYSQSMQDVVTAANAAGSLVVAAMGNDNVSTPMYPAAYDNVLAVSATGPTDAKATYSNYGSHCDVAAPGGDMSYYQDPNGIYSTMPTYPVYLTNIGFYQNYDFLNGTSQAAPHVAGLAALVWSMQPALSPNEVQTMIQDTAVDLGTPGKDIYYGYGRIDVAAALQAYNPPQAPTISPINNPGGDDTYTVNWNDVADATSYTLQEDDNSSFTSPEVVYSGANSQYQVVGQESGPWYYRVRATNAHGDSPWSGTQFVTVKPDAPSLNAINNPGNEDEYQISWSASVAATGYTLEEDNNSSFTSPTVRYMGDALQYNVTGQRGGTWHYRVRAYNAGGNSAWSSSRSTTVATSVLSAPTLDPIDNTDGGDSFSLEWSDVPTSPVSYTLEESRDPYFADPQVIYSGTMTEHQVVDQPGGDWHYRVRALGASDNSPWSNEESTNVRTMVYLPVVLRDYGGPPPAPGWTTIVSEDFEGAFPGVWNVHENDPDFGSYYWGKRNCRAYSGSYSGWGVGGGDGAALSCGSNYPLEVYGWMVYGPFSLADASAADLSFQLWLNTEKDWDYVCRLASIDGVNYDGWCTSGNTAGWLDRELDLADIPDLGNLTGQPNVWIALVFASDTLMTLPEGGYVDDIVLRKHVGTMASSGGDASSGEEAVANDPDTLYETPVSFSINR